MKKLFGSPNVIMDGGYQTYVSVRTAINFAAVGYFLGGMNVLAIAMLILAVANGSSVFVVVPIGAVMLGLFAASVYWMKWME